MDCPACKNVNLTMSDRQGIEIDYCPSCRGVWLDRGELDKLIDRAQASVPAPPAQAVPAQPGRYEQQQARPQRPRYEDNRSYDRSDERYRKKKRGGFLGELFDFD